MTWIQDVIVGCGCGMAFILLRDLVLSLSPTASGNVFVTRMYAVYGVIGGVLGLGVNLLWSL